MKILIIAHLKVTASLTNIPVLLEVLLHLNCVGKLSSDTVDCWTETKTHTYIITNPPHSGQHYLLLNPHPACGTFHAHLCKHNWPFVIEHYFPTNKYYLMRTFVLFCLSKAEFSGWYKPWHIWLTNWITSQVDDKTLIYEGQRWGYMLLNFPKGCYGN